MKTNVNKKRDGYLVSGASWAFANQKILQQQWTIQYICVHCLALYKKKNPPGIWTHGVGNTHRHTQTQQS